jgi:hypothetical protein
MRGPVSFPQEQEYDAPAANTAASVSIAADSKEHWVIESVDFSYDATPSGGSITITSGGTTIYKMAITSAGAYRREFENGLKATKGEAVVVTLAAGGAGVSGTLFVQYR